MHIKNLYLLANQRSLVVGGLLLCIFLITGLPRTLIKQTVMKRQHRHVFKPQEVHKTLATLTSQRPLAVAGPCAPLTLHIPYYRPAQDLNETDSNS